MAAIELMHDAAVRTTVTLDPDVYAKVRELARERGVSFKVALNDAVRAGLGRNRRGEHPYRIIAQPMGVRPGINLDKALQLAGDLEDAEIVRKLELRK